MMNDTEKTYFGNKVILKSEKSDKVASLFHAVAGRYDLMNDVMSFGFHRLWKSFAVHLGNIHAGSYVLDLAGGTADLAIKVSPLVGPLGRVVLADINWSMLEVGRDRLLDEGLVRNVSIVQTNAECLAFPDNFFDCILIGFGLRNVTHQQQALTSMYRCLKPGGVAVILEFSRPTVVCLSRLYDAYSFKLIPKIGKFIAKDEESYRYLVESIRKHPDQDMLLSMMRDAGYDQCDYHNLMGGIVAIHRGYKY